MNEQALELIMGDILTLPCIDEEGEVLNHQQRFWELIGTCITAFSVDLIPQLKELTKSNREINTLVVVGYDKYSLKLMATTKK